MVVVVEAASDDVHDGHPDLAQLEGGSRIRRGEGEPVVRDVLDDMLEGRAGVDEDGAAGFEEFRGSLGDGVLRADVFVHPRGDGAVRLGGDELHASRAAPHLDGLVDGLEVFDIAPQGHARDVREHGLQLLDRHKGPDLQKSADLFAPFVVHGTRSFRNPVKVTFFTPYFNTSGVRKSMDRVKKAGLSW